MYRTNVLSLYMIIWMQFIINTTLLILFDAERTFYFILHTILEIFYITSISLFTICIVNKKENEPIYNLSNYLDSNDYPSITILIPTYNEEIHVIGSTIRNCLELDYPKEKIDIYVLDDGNRSVVENMCNIMNVGYLRRETNKGKKAGNINNALNQIVCKEYTMILDCDMIPKTEMLERMMGYMWKKQKIEHKNVAYIQCPQDFFNYTYENDFYDMKNSTFTKLLLKSFNNYEMTPYIGSGAVFYTNALKEIGGFLEGRSTEDVATGYRLHCKGYTSYYIYEKLVAGICPSNLAQAFEQKKRWVKGDMQLFIHDKPLFEKRLPLIVRIMYFHLSGYWIFSFVFLYQMIVNYIWIFYLLLHDNDYDSRQLWVYQFAFISYFIYFICLPTLSLRAKIRTLQMFITFIPVYISAFIPCTFIQKVSSKENKKHEYHPYFLFHYLILFMQIIASLFIIIQPTYILQKTISIWLVIVTFVLFYPVFRYSLSCCQKKNEIHPSFNQKKYNEKEIQDLIEKEFDKNTISSSGSISTSKSSSLYTSTYSSSKTSMDSDTDSSSSVNFHKIYRIPSYIIIYPYIYTWKYIYNKNIDQYQWIMNTMYQI
mgnify:CR=1 FL=1